MKPRKNYHKRPITSVLIGLGFLSLILLATMIAASQSTNYQYGGNASPNDDNSEKDNEGKVLCVVKNIDSENQLITLLDVDTRVELTLTYTGGTDVTDKYKKIISMSQVPVGAMVDASYDTSNSKLLSMNLSTKAWEYDRANNVGIDLQKQIMSIANKKYQYNGSLSVLDGEDFVTVNTLAKQDEFTVWGYGETIWSIIITKGHGTIKLENYEDYLGNNIRVGSQKSQKIESGLEITAREGESNLTVENGLYSATKSVMVKKDQVTYVSLNDMGPVGPETGSIFFQITPYGADLFVDGKLSTYENAIKLEYGNHKVKVSLGGYNTYDGVVNVNSKSKTVKIKLPVATTKEDPTSTETDNSPTVTPSPTPNPQITGSVNATNKIYVQTPAGASVYFDGSFIGVAPCNYKKIIGSHVLTFIKDGYETKSYTVEIADDNIDAYFNYPELIKTKTN